MMDSELIAGLSNAGCQKRVWARKMISRLYSLVHFQKCLIAKLIKLRCGVVDV